MKSKRVRMKRKLWMRLRMKSRRRLKMRMRLWRKLRMSLKTRIRLRIVIRLRELTLEGRLEGRIDKFIKLQLRSSFVAQDFLLVSRRNFGHPRLFVVVLVWEASPDT